MKKKLFPNVNWIIGRMRNINIRVKVMSLVIGLVLVLGTSSMLEVGATFTHTLEDQWDANAEAVGRQVAGRALDLIIAGDRSALRELLVKTRDVDEDARYLFILDADGAVLAHTFPGAVPSYVRSANRAGGGSPTVAVVYLGGERIRDTAVPIVGGRAGTLHLGLTEARLRNSVAALKWRLLLIAIIVSLAGLVAALMFTSRIIEPMDDLVNVAGALARGDSWHRASIVSGDEIGRLGAAFNAMAESLEQTSQENSRLLVELRAKESMRVRLLDQVIGAQEDERRRVARELHDGTGQSLTAILISLRVLEEASQDCAGCSQSGSVRSHAEGARAVASQTLDEVRRLARDLRPAVLDDLGLPAALERCSKEFARMCNIPIDYQVVGMDDVRLLPQVETALYRIAQEALTNAARHSGAHSVNLALERHGDSIHVVVEDDGSGFDVEARLANLNGSGLGLFGMKERAGLVGGTLTVESVPGFGTTVFVQVPLMECVLGEESEKDSPAAG